jgi:hypothetical protein
MAIIHRTVRWCTRLSGEPTVASANGQPCNLRATRGLLQRSAGAPDCPVCTGQCPVRQSAQGSNGRKCQIWKEIKHRIVYRTCPVAHWTVRCALDSVRFANQPRGATVVNAKFGRRSSTGSSTGPVRWRTGLSGAPLDRRQG